MANGNGSGEKLAASLNSSGENATSGSRDIRNAASDHSEDTNERDGDIPKQHANVKTETEKDEELKKRREREAALSEDELNNLREESRNLKVQGNDQFAEGFWFEAVQSYTKALDVCPLQYNCDRATYLSNRAAAYIKVKDWEKAIKDCTEALEMGAPNEKPLERRAYCYSQLEDKYEQAVEDYESLTKMHPDRKNVYSERIFVLKRAIEERNERTKQEMISKLKDLGNMCLKPFGLSTDNFELKQQPGGGYSITMKKS